MLKSFQIRAQSELSDLEDVETARRKQIRELEVNAAGSECGESEFQHSKHKHLLKKKKKKKNVAQGDIQMHFAI